MTATGTGVRCASESSAASSPSSVSTAGWTPAASSSQLGDGLLQLADGALEHRLGVGGEPGSEPHLRGPELEREGEQALLRTVVEVALDAPALLVTGRHDSPCDSWTRAS